MQRLKDTRHSQPQASSSLIHYSTSLIAKSCYFHLAPDLFHTRLLHLWLAEASSAICHAIVKTLILSYRLWAPPLPVQCSGLAELEAPAGNLASQPRRSIWRAVRIASSTQLEELSGQQ